ncbi:MAG: hypothetical protein LC732_12730 [Acidobacteria bacterium]|nr:hypothetical protein [Acidobacteriota bacterium]
MKTDFDVASEHSPDTKSNEHGRSLFTAALQPPQPGSVEQSVGPAARPSADTPDSWRNHAMPRPVTRLLFVYNANPGALNSIIDSIKIHAAMRDLEVPW